MKLEEAEMTSKRRDRLNIDSQILEIAADPTLKTQIMYKANLSFAQLNEYVDFMTKNSLLEKLSNNRKEMYRSTEKGLNFTRRYCELTELMRTKEEDKVKEMRAPPENLLKKK